FADHREELREPIRAGRREFLAQFRNLADEEVIARLPAPDAERTFEACKIDRRERERHASAYALHRDLLALRRNDPAIRAAATRRGDGAVLASAALALRYFGGAAGDRLLIVNLGCDLDLAPAPEPLLAPPTGTRWTALLDTESVRYGGHGRSGLN